MKLSVLPAASDEKPILQRMIELYIYDFTEIEKLDLDEQGLFGYPYLDLYWTEAGHHPFLVRVDGKPAGFVLVNAHTFLPGNERSIAEFFVMRRYRRQGVGRAAAFAVFDALPGKWEVQELDTNVAAHAFWRAAIRDYTGGNFSETFFKEDNWQGPVQYFDNSGGRPAHGL
ncbi:MAG: GNAT family N-acetyltransferase [Chloroflexi bacterium]|nr:GNAT family N-acetyltransferase [Chloroflexota bacterium]